MHVFKYFFLIWLLSFFQTYAQNNFSIINKQEKEKISFKLVNNLVLLPVVLNGEEFTFLLDTGVKQSLLFNVSTIDKINLNQVKKIKVKGLGQNVEFDALRSKGNLLRIGNVVCPNFDLLVILDKKIDFSERMGTDIHGIIGSEIFKDLVIEVNYNTKKIIFNKPESYQYKKCKKCETFPLSFYHQKPYIQGSITTFSEIEYPVKLLIDSGGGDSLWLFGKSIDGYKIPNKNFTDLLGRGLSGDIFGKKSKLKSFNIGTFEFNNFIIAHPDSTATIGSNFSSKRNGLMGAEILKRFHVIYDYPHKKITFKKNKRFYGNHFPYNKSGMEIVYYGKVLVRERVSDAMFESKSLSQSVSKSGNNFTGNITSVYTTYSYSYKNAYQISYVKPNSIAAKVGILKGDLIAAINGRPAYEYTLQDIIQLLSGEAKKKIKLKISRNFILYKYNIVLEDLL